MNVINLSELQADWCWLRDAMPDRHDLHWQHFTSASEASGVFRPLRRVHAARLAVGAVGSEPGVLVSHGPRPAVYGTFAAAGRRNVRHLVFSFNFTTLPIGLRRKVMRFAFKYIDRFVVFSTAERSLYSRAFGIPPERIDMLHWAVRPPTATTAELPLAEGDYVCAVGSQGRDLATLCKAMNLLPSLRLELVTTREAIAGIEPPPNVRVRLSLPLRDTMNIMRFSRFMVLPLRDAEVPCGHVTIVSAMHLGKAVVATDSTGVHDYLRSEENGLLVEPSNPRAMATAIERLCDDEALGRQLGTNGQAFAATHCVEARTVDYFRRYLEKLPAR